MKFARYVLGVVLSFSSLWLFNHAVKGQDLTGPSLRGKALDSLGRPVSGASVSLRLNGTPMPLISISGADGSYFFVLKVGLDYELSAEYKGLSSAAIPLRVSNSDEKVALNLKLLPSIQFEDITGKAGLEFTLNNGASGRSYQPEIMLGGVAAFDFDNDGCQDIFFTNGASLPSLKKTGPEFHNRLYRNNCNGTFTDVTSKAGLAGEGYSMGVGAADYDNDGFADLLVTGVKGNTLYRNKGDGTFENVTIKVGLDVPDPKFGRMWSIAAGWFDYDNDGYLDLFVTNYVAWTPESEQSCSDQGMSFYCHPRVFKGLPNQLFHNNGDGTFTDVSMRSGIRASIGKGMGLAFGDFNGDGLLDIFVANDSTPNFLFRNLGAGKFQECALQMGVAYPANGKAVAGMGVDFRDFNDDGLEDIAMNAMYFDTFPLFRNLGKPKYFIDDTSSSGVAIATRNLTGWSMGLYDFDNDGHKDLFYASSHFPGSDPYVHSPAEIPNHILRNMGGGFFEDVSGSAGSGFQRPALYHGAAFADFDNDGRVDVVVTALNGTARLFRNVSKPDSHWIALRLSGMKSNRSGLGAGVKLTLPTGTVKYNRTSTSVGYASSSEAIVRFGLGPYDRATKIEIRWPSGQLQMLNDQKADRLLVVKENMVSLN